MENHLLKQKVCEDISKPFILFDIYNLTTERSRDVIRIHLQEQECVFCDKKFFWISLMYIHDDENVQEGHFISYV